MILKINYTSTTATQNKSHCINARNVTYVEQGNNSIMVHMTDGQVQSVQGVLATLLADLETAAAASTLTTVNY
jgi:DNA-binding LytR/AlgR family response regulator